MLASYKIEPEPKIVELNVRSDGPLIQDILARLTGRRTVPNILLKVRLGSVVLLLDTISDVYFAGRIDWRFG